MSSVHTSPGNRRLQLRLAAAAIALAALMIWVATGANLGWSKDQIALKKTDEVTGIEYIEYQKKYVPGIEFLGIGLAAAGAIAAASFFIRKQTSQP